MTTYAFPSGLLTPGSSTDDGTTGGGLDLGFLVVVNIAGLTATGVRWYATDAAAGKTATPYLWSGAGAQLATGPAVTLVAGWNNLPFTTPVALASGGDYVPAVHLPSSGEIYSYTASAWPKSTTQFSVGSGNQGRYNYSATPGLSATSGSVNGWFGIDIVATDGTSSSPTTATPTGIPTALSFGALAAALALTAAPTGIATAAAVGTPSVTTALTAGPSAIASTEAFGVTAAVPTAAATPTGIATTEAFGTPAVATAMTAQPDGVPTAAAFGALQAVVSGAASPTGIPSGEAVGAPTALPLLTAAPIGIASLEAIGQPASTQQLQAAPSGIGSLAALGLPLAVSSLTAAPASIPSAATFGVPRSSLGRLRDLTITADPLASRWAAAALPSRLATDLLPPRWQVTPEATMRTLFLSEGFTAFVGGTIRETEGKDISSATIKVAFVLTSDTPPPSSAASWTAPTTDEAGPSTAVRLVKYLPPTDTPPGVYRLWAWISDNPEDDPLVLEDGIRVR